jgi:hypothetical protein
VKRRRIRNTKVVYKELLKVSKKLLKDKKKLKALLEYVIRLTHAHKEKLGGVWDDLQCIFRLMNAWIRGDYRRVPQASLVLIVTLMICVALYAYGLHWLLATAVDLGLVRLIISNLKEELQAFREWEASRPKQTQLVVYSIPRQWHFPLWILRLLGPIANRS